MSQRMTLALSDGDEADSGSNGINGGRFAYNGGNETELDAYDDDAALMRIGGTIRTNGGGGGGTAFDNLPDGPGGRRVQMILWHGEQSEQVRGEVGNPMGSLSCHVNNGQGEADSNMLRAFALEAKTGISKRDGSHVEAFYLGAPQWESLIRQLMEKTNSVAPPPAEGNYDGAQFYGSKKAFLYARQKDGHDVLYKIAADGSMSPIWTSDGGAHGTWMG